MTLPATPPRIEHRRQALVVGQPVDDGAPRLVRRQPVQHRARAVDRVHALPRPRAVRAHAADGDLDPQRPLAAGLDAGVGRLHQDGEVGGQPVGVGTRDAAEAVALGLDLLVVVEDVRDVAARGGHGRGQPQRDGDAALHVARAEAVEPVVHDARGEVVRRRHGVEVSGDQDALGAAEAGARDDRVPVPVDAQVGVGPQGALDGVRQGAFGAAHRGPADELGGQGRPVEGQVEVGAGVGTRAAHVRNAIRHRSPCASDQRLAIAGRRSDARGRYGERREHDHRARGLGIRPRNHRRHRRPHAGHLVPRSGAGLPRPRRRRRPARAGGARRQGRPPWRPARGRPHGAGLAGRRARRRLGRVPAPAPAQPPPGPPARAQPERGVRPAGQRRLDELRAVRSRRASSTPACGCGRPGPSRCTGSTSSRG